MSASVIQLRKMFRLQSENNLQHEQKSTNKCGLQRISWTALVYFAKKVIFSVRFDYLFVFLSVCKQEYTKPTELISVKLGGLSLTWAKKEPIQFGNRSKSQGKYTKLVPLIARHGIWCCGGLGFNSMHPKMQ